jgi:hypothetical protein
MKAITLTQPWATLVAIGAKRIETRSWSTTYRGPLALHAAAGLGPIGGKRGLLETIALSNHMRNALNSAGLTNIDELPRGAIVAVCELVDIYKIPDGVTGFYAEESSIRFDLTPQERAFGDFTPGRFAWLLDTVRRLDAPILVKGALGLWEWDGGIPSP